MSNIIKIPRICVKMFDKEALINSIFILFPARKLCKLLPFKKAKKYIYSPKHYYFMDSNGVWYIFM